MIEQFYIGTYTHRTSTGIYQLELDTKLKKLKHLHLVGVASDPTYLALSQKKLYSVNKIVDQRSEKVVGGVRVFDRNTDNSLLPIVQSVNDEYLNPSYIAIDHERQLLFTANYHDGEISTYRIGPNGLIQLADRIKHIGSTGPKKEQIDGPHPHYMNLTPDGRVVVCDLGLDKVYIYSVNSTGKLTNVSNIQLEPGFGPRHIVFSQSFNVAYVIGELSSKIAVLDYNSTDGILTKKQLISTIPNSWKSHNGAAAIRISKDSKYIYATNRGNNTIAVFKVVSANQINLIQRINSGGDFPRDFNFSSDESFLICLNQNTDNATLFERNARTGKLAAIQKGFKVPEGICLIPAL